VSEQNAAAAAAAAAGGPFSSSPASRGALSPLSLFMFSEREREVCCVLSSPADTKSGKTNNNNKKILYMWRI